jgi:hypothetical protein
MPPRRRNARWRRRTLRWRPASTCPLGRYGASLSQGPARAGIPQIFGKGWSPGNVKRLRLMPQRNARQSPAPGVRSSSTDGPRRQYRLHCAVAGGPAPPCPAPPSACLCRQARSMGSTRCVRRQHTSEERLSRPVRYSHRLKQTEQRLSATSRADLQSRSLVPILLPSYRSCPEGDLTLHRLGRGLLRTTSFAAIQGEFVSPCHGDPDSANAAAGELT